MAAISNWFSLLLLASVLAVTLCRLPHSHVIRMSPQLRAQGFQGDVPVGEVVGEARVDSAHACGSLCQDHPECRTVMFFPPLCRMFAQPCRPCFDLPGETSSYLIARHDSVTSFRTAMERCVGLGAHTVHINSQDEHELIKHYIRESGLGCNLVWTGGWSEVSGSTVLSDWRWHYSPDLSGPSDPLTYIKWGTSQPNNSTGEEHVIMLTDRKDFDFNDKKPSADSQCFICECP